MLEKQENQCNERQSFKLLERSWNWSQSGKGAKFKNDILRGTISATHCEFGMLNWWRIVGIMFRIAINCVDEDIWIRRFKIILRVRFEIDHRKLVKEHEFFWTRRDIDREGVGWMRHIEKVGVRFRQLWRREKRSSTSSNRMKLNETWKLKSGSSRTQDSELEILTVHVLSYRAMIRQERERERTLLRSCQLAV